MITLDDIIEAANTAAVKETPAPTGTESVLIYGEPKVGKTTLAATLAEAPEVDRVFLFMLENGHQALLTAFREGRLSKEALKKIILIKIPDTREDPNGISALLKTIASKKAAWICDAHGVVECVECKRANKAGITFDHKSLTNRDWVVVDSLSQAGISALNLACKGFPVEYKPTFDEWGLQGKYLSDLLTVIQAAPYCNFLCITHVLLLEDEKDKNDKLYPLCGTKNFSMNVASKFGSVIYLQKTMGKIKATSSHTASPKTMTGSRLGIVLEKQKELDLVAAFREAGFFPSIQPTGSESVEKPATSTEPASSVAPKFGSRFSSNKP